VIAAAVAKYPGDVADQIQYYNQWNQANFRKVSLDFREETGKKTDIL